MEWYKYMQSSIISVAVTYLNVMFIIQFKIFPHNCMITYALS